MRPVSLSVLLALTVAGTARAQSYPKLTREYLRAIHALEAESPSVRREAAKQLCHEENGPPLEAVPALMVAVQRESYPDPFDEMLRCLGASGIREARPLVEAHLGSDDDGLRGAAEKGMRRWFIRNHVLGKDDPLPPPPHPIYGPLLLRTDAAAARSLEDLLGQSAPPITRLPEPTLERRSKASRVGGIVALSVGGGAAVIGAAALVIGQIDHDVGRHENENVVWAAPLALGGVGLAAAGGCMLYIGSQWVDIEHRPGALGPRPLPAARGITLRAEF